MDCHGMYLFFFKSSRDICPQMLCLNLCSPACDWKSSSGKAVTVEEGSVTRVRKTTLEVCEGGQLKLKMKADVGPNYTLACNGK